MRLLVFAPGAVKSRQEYVREGFASAARQGHTNEGYGLKLIEMAGALGEAGSRRPTCSSHAAPGGPGARRRPTGETGSAVRSGHKRYSARRANSFCRARS